jgi:hypothetical protein
MKNLEQWKIRCIAQGAERGLKISNNGFSGQSTVPTSINGFKESRKSGTITYRELPLVVANRRKTLFVLVILKLMEAVGDIKLLILNTYIIFHNKHLDLNWEI